MKKEKSNSQNMENIPSGSIHHLCTPTRNVKLACYLFPQQTSFVSIRCFFNIFGDLFIYVLFFFFPNMILHKDFLSTFDIINLKPSLELAILFLSC